MQPGFTAVRRILLSAAFGSTALLASNAALAADQPALDVPYVPTPQEVVDRMLELGAITPSDYVIDLGSGDGRIPVTAAKRYGVRALGVDLNPVRIEEAQENARKNEVTDKVELKVQNLFDTPIGEANVLTMYLLPRVNMQLRPRILSELKPGSRVVSHAFDMEDWQPDRRESVDGRTIYLWIVPAQVEGTWKVETDAPFSLELAQRFQEVEGTATVQGKKVPLADVKLEGARLQFALNGKRYVGVVDGQTIKAEDGSWQASKS